MSSSHTRTGQGPFLASLVRALRNWRGERAPPTRTRDCCATGSVLPVMAHDAVPMSTSPGKWPDSADLLTRRMIGLQIDPVAFRSTFPDLAREAERNCVLCRDTADCRRELDDGVERPDWETRCPNAGVLVAASARGTSAS
jgi:hypothetical protein